MSALARSYRPLLLVLPFLAIACADGQGPVSPDVPSDSVPDTTAAEQVGDTMPTAPVFSVFPVDLDSVYGLTPMGNVNPGSGHVIPVDHSYILTGDWTTTGPGRTLAVRAPAAGVVASIKPNDAAPGQALIMISVTPAYTYYFDHVLVDAALSVGDTLAVGDIIGVTDASYSQAFDFGVYHREGPSQDCWVNPDRYIDMTRLADSPWRWFPADLKARILDLVRTVSSGRTESELMGRVCQDVAGTLAGDWFLDGLTGTIESFETPSKQLAFLHRAYEPAVAIVSIGGTIGDAQERPVVPGMPDFATITPDDGLVALQLQAYGPQTEPVDWVLVQLQDSVTLRAEFVPDIPVGSAPPNAFSANARLYRR